MKTDNIKQLIESFYCGETSHSEELLLLNYFKSDNVADDLQDERDIFLELYISESVLDEITVPKSLAPRLENLIDNLATAEEKKRPTIRRTTLWCSVAASVAIVLSAGIYMSNDSILDNLSEYSLFQQQEKQEQITDAEYMQAENAMRLLSANFNKGMDQLQEMTDKLDETSQILNKTFNNSRN